MKSMPIKLIGALVVSCAIARVPAAELVINGSFEAGNTGFTSEFANSPDIEQPRTYAITTDPASVHSLAASYGDHTTGSGFMMAVNGTDIDDPDTTQV
jgi:hypothetical protein